MTDSNELDSDIKIAMYNCADTAILAVDSSKFDRVSFVKSMMLKKGDAHCDRSEAVSGMAEFSGGTGGSSGHTGIKEKGKVFHYGREDLQSGL